MKLSVVLLLNIWQKSGLGNLNLELDFTESETGKILSDIGVRKTGLNPEYLKKLRENKTDEVNIVYNKKLEQILKEMFPRRFGKKERDNLLYLNLLSKQFEFSNKYSSIGKNYFKKREIIVLQEIFSARKQSSKVVVHYNTFLTEKVLNILKAQFNENYNLNYTVNEGGILLIYDTKGYENNRQQIKLQFMVRKIFSDLSYKNIITAEVDSGFKNYFMPPDKIFPKLVIFCGKTINNRLLYQRLRIFDPFAKIEWMTVNDLEKKSDDIFDSVVRVLGEDYSYEYNLYSSPVNEKNRLSVNEQKDYRDRISRLGRSFSVNDFTKLAFEIEEKNKTCDIEQQRSQLYNILSGTRQTKEKIFDHFLKRVE